MSHASKINNTYKILYDIFRTLLNLPYSVLTLFRILPGKKFSWRRCFNCLDVKQVSYNYNEMYQLQLMPDGKLYVVAGHLLILFYVGSF